MLKFVFNVEKLKSHQIHLVKGHNRREGHNCASQLENKAAWFTKEGLHTFTPWNSERLANAHKLAKRKDAVEAISIVIQVGNQADWREAANKACPEGKPKASRPVDLNALAKSSRDWAEAEFGKENVVSIEAHTDESTPHLHIIVTPIKNGKLQAKHWLDGPSALASLRSRAHAAISLEVPCEYEKGRDGGAPHDPGKAAGKVRSPNPQAKSEKTTGLLARLTGAGEVENERLTKENERLQAENLDLAKQLQYNGRRRVAVSDLQERLEAAVERFKAIEDLIGGDNPEEALQDAHRRIQRYSSDLHEAEMQLTTKNARIADLTTVLERRDAHIQLLREENDSAQKMGVDLWERVKELENPRANADFDGPSPT
jgi:hypothetical protein